MMINLHEYDGTLRSLTSDILLSYHTEATSQSGNSDDMQKSSMQLQRTVSPAPNSVMLHYCIVLEYKIPSLNPSTRQIPPLSC